MTHMETRDHWDKIYLTRQPTEVSWTQAVPETSLNLIHSFGLPRTAGIIDIGGGDSKLVDFLLDEGFEDITVLDISEHALSRAKVRLGKRANQIKWIISDITTFEPDREYDLWHDRAAFHFLTAPIQVVKYIGTALRCVPEGGYVIIGTFSETGPDKCSGLEIRKYSEAMLQEELSRGFKKLKCLTEDHVTPFGKIQNFIFCGFQRTKASSL